jgi:hypothetical protein
MMMTPKSLFKGKTRTRLTSGFFLEQRMNIFEKVCNELGWDTDSDPDDHPEIKEVMAMAEDEAMSRSIAFLQQLYISTLRFREVGDEDCPLADYFITKHRQARNALVKHSKEFDYEFYDEWCRKQFYPNEFLRKKS